MIILGMYMGTYYGNMIELVIYDNTSACTTALIPVLISKVITRILLQQHKYYAQQCTYVKLAHSFIFSF
jgi:hypothetical protein